MSTPASRPSSSTSARERLSRGSGSKSLKIGASTTGATQVKTIVSATTRGRTGHPPAAREATDQGDQERRPAAGEQRGYPGRAGEVPAPRGERLGGEPDVDRTLVGDHPGRDRGDRGGDRDRDPDRRGAEHRSPRKPVEAAADRLRPARRRREEDRDLDPEPGEEEPALPAPVVLCPLDLGGGQVVGRVDGNRLGRDPRPGRAARPPPRPRGSSPPPPRRLGLRRIAPGSSSPPTIVAPSRGQTDATRDLLRHPRQPARPRGRARRERRGGGRRAMVPRRRRRLRRRAEPMRQPDRASGAPARWSATTTSPCSIGSTSRPSRRPPRRRSAGPGSASSPRPPSSSRGLEPADEEPAVALYHASPRDPVWEYVLWPDQAAECIRAQARRVSFDRPLPRRALLRDPGGGRREPARRPRRPGRRGDGPRSLPRALADQPGQRRPAARRRSARRLARARHRRLDRDLPSGRLRHRPRRRRDHGDRPARAPRPAAVRRAVRAVMADRSGLITSIAAVPLRQGSALELALALVAGLRRRGRGVRLGQDGDDPARRRERAALLPRTRSRRTSRTRTARSPPSRRGTSPTASQACRRRSRARCDTGLVQAARPDRGARLAALRMRGRRNRRPPGRADDHLDDHLGAGGDDHGDDDRARDDHLGARARRRWRGRGART